ncbi:MAG: hypothetical protein R3B09_19890 [Nannocystaceae bacterium]
MIEYVNYIALAALVHALPKGPGIEADWLESTLVATLAHYHAGAPEDLAAEAHGSRAWAIGGVQGTETLVQSRPVVRDPSTRFVVDFLRAPSQCTIAGYSVAGDLVSVPPRVTITRFQRWVAIFSEGELGGGEAPADEVRTRLRDELPEFFHRSLADGSDRELVGMSTIAKIHAETTLSKSYVPPEVFRGALRSIDAVLGAPPRAHILVTDGRTVGVLHRGGQMLALRPPVPTRVPRAIAVPRGEVELHDPALLLVYAPLGWGHPPEETAPAAVVDEGVFTASARHPVRIERD